MSVPEGEIKVSAGLAMASVDFAPMLAPQVSLPGFSTTTHVDGEQQDNVESSNGFAALVRANVLKSTLRRDALKLHRQDLREMAMRAKISQEPRVEVR